MLFALLSACAFDLETVPGLEGERVASGVDWVDLGDPLTAVTVGRGADGGCEPWATTGAGHLARSPDQGETWEVIAAGDGDDTLSAVTSVTTAGGTSVWAVGLDGRVVSVDPKGKVRDEALGTTDYADIALSPREDGSFDGWIVGRAGRLRVTHDGGRTWERRDLATRTDLTAVAVDHSGAAPEVWVAGAEGLLLRSEGSGWVPAEVVENGKPVRLTTDLLALAFSPGGGWAAGADGTVLRREPGQSTWTRTHLPNSSARLYGILPLDQVLEDGARVLVSGNGGVFSALSGDGTWNPVDWPEHAPTNSWNGLAAGDGCVIAVGDDGAVAKGEASRNELTWSVVRSGWRPGINALAAAETRRRREVLAVGRSGTVLQNSGAGWRLLDAHTTANLLSADLYGPGNGWVGGLGVVQRLRDGSWRSSVLPPDVGTQAAFVAVDADSPGDAWAFARGGAILRLSDPREGGPPVGEHVTSLPGGGGVTSGCALGDTLLVGTTRGVARYRADADVWDRLATRAPSATVGASFAEMKDEPGAVRAIRCDDTSRAWVLGAIPGGSEDAPRWGVYTTRDAGDSWRLEAAGQSDTDLFGLSGDGAEGPGLVVGAQGSAQLSDDGWLTARTVVDARSAAFDGAQVVPRLRAAALTGSSGWIAGDGMTLLRGTVDGEWHDVAPSFREILQSADEAVILTDDNWVLTTHDQGRTWSPEPGCGAITGTNGGTVLADGTMLLVGDHGAIVRRPPGGGACATFNLDEDVTLASIASGPDGRLLLVGERGRLYVGTLEGGFARVPWERGAAEGASDLRDVVFLPDGTAWIVGDAGTVLTFDGERARRVTVPTTGDERERSLQEDLRAITVVGSDLFAVGEHGALIHSPDAGTTWAELPIPVTEDLQAILLTGEQGWIVGDRGAILETRDGGRNWEPIHSATRASLRAIAYGGALGEGGLVVGDGATILQANHAIPPASASAVEARRVGDTVRLDVALQGNPGARYQARRVELREAGRDWDQVAFTSEPTDRGLTLIIPDSPVDPAAMGLTDGVIVETRVTLADGRRSWVLTLPVKTKWETWVGIATGWLGLLVTLPATVLFCGLFLYVVWPRALLKARSLEWIVQALNQVLGAWGAPLTVLVVLAVALQRTTRVRRAWLGDYRLHAAGPALAPGALHFEEVSPETAAAFIRDLEVQRAVVDRYRADAIAELQRALGVSPSRGTFSLPARVSGRVTAADSVEVFKTRSLRAGVVHIRASLDEGAQEYLCAVTVAACTSSESEPIGAIPVLLGDGEDDVVRGVQTALTRLFFEQDQEAITPAFVESLLADGQIVVASMGTENRAALLASIRALRRGGARSLVLLAAPELGGISADVVVTPRAWPIGEAVEHFIDEVPEEDRDRVRTTVRCSLRDELGVGAEGIDLPPRLVRMLVRLAQRPDQAQRLVPNAVTAWLLQVLRPPAAFEAAWHRAICQISGLASDGDPEVPVRAFKFDATVASGLDGAANDVLAAAARAGILVTRVRDGQCLWEFRHAAVARVCARLA